MINEMDYEDWLEDKARFCLVLRIAPSEYDNLTDEERAEFIRVHNEMMARRS